MPTIIERLARWARDLQPADLPPRVRERALLQHLSVAGAVRAVRDRPLAHGLRAGGASRGTALVATGGTAPRRDAVRLHAGLSVWLDYDDYLFLAHTGHGAVPAAWAAARRHSLGEILCATVIANEVAGRLGASLLLGPANGQEQAVVTAAGTAAALGWLDGLDAQQMAHAIALALVVPPAVPHPVLLSGGDAKALVAAVPAVHGVESVDLARSGVRGSLDLLDTPDGLLGRLSWVPLRAAFTGLGRAWLTETLAYKSEPACAYVQAPVEAVAEILRRHVRAADKRLRPDQVERVEVSVGATGWVLEQLVAEARRGSLTSWSHGGYAPAAIPFSMRRAIAVQLVAHELGPRQLTEEWLAGERDRLAELAARIEIRHDWRHTLGLVEHLVEVAAPLFAGLTRSELRRTLALARAAYGTSLPCPGAADLLALVRVRPDRLLERIRYASGDLADARLEEWQFRFGADVRVFTIRGGSWPERRDIPVASPGWPWQETVEAVLAKYAQGDEQLRARGRRLIDAADSADAVGFVEELLA